MVAYSFQKEFVNPVRVGLGLEPLRAFPPAVGPKTHTMRDKRKGKGRHARIGEALQLYYAQRSRVHSMLINADVPVRCVDVQPVGLVFDDSDPEEGEGVIAPGLGIISWGYDSLDAFAIGDGFKDWAALRRFWREHHPGVDQFDGEIIFWEVAT